MCDAYSDLVEALEGWFHNSPRGTAAVAPCSTGSHAVASTGPVFIAIRGANLLPPAHGRIAPALSQWATAESAGFETDASVFRGWLAARGTETVRVYGEPFDAALVNRTIGVLPLPSTLRIGTMPLPAAERPMRALFIDAADWRVVVSPVGFRGGTPRSFPSWPPVRWEGDR